MNKEETERIKNNLSIEQIYNLLLSLGGNPILKENIIISQTICHRSEIVINFIIMIILNFLNVIQIVQKKVLMYMI